MNKSSFLGLLFYLGFFIFLLGGPASHAAADTPSSSEAIQELGLGVSMKDSDYRAAKTMCIHAIHASHKNNKLSDKQIVHLARYCAHGEFHSMLLELGHDVTANAEKTDELENSILEAADHIDKISSK